MRRIESILLRLALEVICSALVAEIGAWFVQ
jgi:hypothetical protein